MDSKNRFYRSVTLRDVVLRVADLGRMRSFYCDVLSFAVVTEDAQRISLSPDGKLPALVTLVHAPDAAPRPRGTSGLFHIAFLYPDRAALGRAARHVIGKSIHLATGDHGVSEALYLDDPEGNGLELYADRDVSVWPKATSPTDALGMYTEAVDLAAVTEEGERTPGPLMPPDVRIGHIHLSVANLETTERFYTQVLGLDVTVRSFPGALFLSRDGYHHHIGTNIWRSRLPVVEGTLGLARFTLNFSNVDDVSHVAAALHHPPATEPLVLHDPSGIEIVVTH